MRCPVCHTEYPPGHQFCMSDGAALLADAPEASGAASDRLAANLAVLDATIDARGPAPSREPTVRLPSGVLPAQPLPAQPLPPASPSMHPAALVGLGALACALLFAMGFFAYQTVVGRPASGAAPLVSFGGGSDEATSDPAAPVSGDGSDASGVVLDPIWDDDDEPALPPPSASSPVVREASIPGGTVEVVQTGGTDLRLVARGPFGVSYAPKPLSTRTRLTGFAHRRLAGRDVVEFEANDGRWRVTYFWEYAPNVMHFVATDQQNGDVNVSRQAYTPDVLRAALGRVPQRTWRSGEEADAARAATPDQTFNVVLGAYPSSDRDGYAERLRRVRASGREIRTASSEDIGMRAGFRILYIGPLRRDAAYRMLDEMRQFTGDAYLSNAR